MKRIIKYIAILVVIMYLIASWFLPIIPVFTSKIIRVPGCYSFAFETLKYITSDSDNLKPFEFEELGLKRPEAIISWGECAIN